MYDCATPRSRVRLAHSRSRSSVAPSRASANRYRRAWVRPMPIQLAGGSAFVFSSRPADLTHSITFFSSSERRGHLNRTQCGPMFHKPAALTRRPFPLVVRATTRYGSLTPFLRERPDHNATRPRRVTLEPIVTHPPSFDCYHFHRITVPRALRERSRPRSGRRLRRAIPENPPGRSRSTPRSRCGRRPCEWDRLTRDRSAVENAGRAQPTSAAGAFSVHR